MLQLYHMTDPRTTSRQERGALEIERSAAYMEIIATMKCELAVCVVLVAIAGLQAAPQWTRLIPAASLDKGLGVIWSNCTTASDMAVVDKVTFMPPTPVLGEDFTASGELTLKEEVTRGSITLDIKYGGITVIDKMLDLCVTVSDVGLKCPLDKGLQKFTITKSIPGLLPKGRYTASATATDQNGQELLCADLDITFQ